MAASYSCTSHCKNTITRYLDSDPDWKNDLLYYYLCSNKPVNSNKTHYFFRVWYWEIGSKAKELCCSRFSVYKLLTTEGNDTNPNEDKDVFKSLIPWNQRHSSFKEYIEKLRASARTKYQKALAAHKPGTAKQELKLPPEADKQCGTVVKVFFRTYMKYVLHKTLSLTNGTKVIDACRKIIKKLEKNEPVRICLENKWHYIGIVGREKKDFDEHSDFKFLCIEPWAGNTEILYGNPKVTTKFLGIVIYKKTEKKLVYIRNLWRPGEQEAEVTSVEV